jgi:uroporphyrin-III C-methyltransferase
MQLDIGVDGRNVVVFGSASGSRRAIRRFLGAGARVTSVVCGPGSPVEDQSPGTEAGTGRASAEGDLALPGPDDPAGLINLMGPAWLVVLVGLDGREAGRIRQLCGHLQIMVTEEPPAAPGGSVTLVGGGPGALSLLTIGACDALRDADVVFYDRLAPTTELARLAPVAELVDVGKRPYHHPVSQPEIDALLVERARAGDAVVRYKGGDCFVFGRGGEEVSACLRAGVPVRVVPGVSSSIAVPAAAGIPVTHRGVSRAFTVISGHVPPVNEELAALARLGGTLVILMGVLNLPQIVAGLLAAGLPADTATAVVERGFSDTQRTTYATLGNLPEEVRRVDVSPPAVVVVGPVVDLASWPGTAKWSGTADWSEALPTAAASRPFAVG